MPLLLQQLLQVLTGLAVLGLGLTALTARGPARRLVPRHRVLRWPWGLLGVLAGVALLAAVRIPFLTFFAAVLSLLLVLVGAVAPVVRHGGRRAVVGSSALAVALVAVGLLQPLGLKVLLLPRADDLPYRPVAASRVVATYDAGMWFEGVEAGPDGSLYLSQSTGEDYAHADKSQVRATVLVRGTDGRERVLAELPQGSTAGVMAVAEDGTLYLSVTGGQQGLWRIDPDGTAALLAGLPEDSFPNGVTLSEDGSTAYVADAALATVWMVDVASGAVGRAYEGDALARRRFVALPPGANGIHLLDGDAWVTNSDAGTLLRFPILGDGRFGDPEVVVSGVPADDFALDEDGTAYLTTHIYDTVVRVDPDGTRSVIADERQDVTGATDCALVVAPDGSRTLYVVTDGGALATGDAEAAGTLVALDLGRP
jgi:sugar lactone lactonase YvrE